LHREGRPGRARAPGAPSGGLPAPSITVSPTSSGLPLGKVPRSLLPAAEIPRWRSVQCRKRKCIPLLFAIITMIAASLSLARPVVVPRTQRYDPVPASSVRVPFRDFYGSFPEGFTSPLLRPPIGEMGAIPMSIARLHPVPPATALKPSLRGCHYGLGNIRTLARPHPPPDAPQPGWLGEMQCISPGRFGTLPWPDAVCAASGTFFVVSLSSRRRCHPTPSPFRTGSYPRIFTGERHRRVRVFAPGFPVCRNISLYPRFPPPRRPHTPSITGEAGKWS